MADFLPTMRRLISVGDCGLWVANSIVCHRVGCTPLMEKLVEAYLAINTNAEIEIQQSDSTVGMQSAISGAYDIGMASRDLKESELAEGLVPTVIATDGIAVIVNPSNGIAGLSSEQVKSIYTGEATDWAQVQG